MPVSVWGEKTKRDIDRATEKIIRLVSNGDFTYDKQYPDGQRKNDKNERFLKDYIISPKLRDHIVLSLQPTQCCDVQIDELQDINRNGNLMYIYFYECELNKRGERISDPKHHIVIYIKIEIIKPINGAECCLVISFHNADYPGHSRYEQLPN